MTYTVIIPIFNEEKNVKNLINKLKKSFLISNLNCVNIILINDGSFDNSKKLLEKYSKKINKIVIINHSQNYGYGAALKTGIKYSRKLAKYGIFIDSDLTNPINDIKKIDKLIKRNIDFIQANRYKKNTNKIETHRKLIGILGNFLCKFFMNMKINDYTNGFRAVKLKLYNNIKLNENDFSIIMEEKYRLKKYLNTIAEFETILGKRKNNLAKSSFQYSFKLIMKYLIYCLMTILKINNKLIKID